MSLNNFFGDCMFALCEHTRAVLLSDVAVNSFAVVFSEIFRNIDSSRVWAVFGVHYVVESQECLSFVLNISIFFQSSWQYYHHCGIYLSKVFFVAMNQPVFVLICLRLSLLARVIWLTTCIRLSPSFFFLFLVSHVGDCVCRRCLYEQANWKHSSLELYPVECVY